MSKAHDHDHDHDHEGHNHITLLDEEGKEAEFEMVLSFENEGREYVVLFPLDGSTEDEGVILRVEEDDDGEGATFLNLSDEEFDEVLPVYSEIVAGMADDEDEEDEEED